MSIQKFNIIVMCENSSLNIQDNTLKVTTVYNDKIVNILKSFCAGKFFISTSYQFLKNNLML